MALLYSPDWLGTQYADQAGLELTDIHLPLLNGEIKGACHHILL